MDSEAMSPFSDFDVLDSDWEDLHAILTGGENTHGKVFELLKQIRLIHHGTENSSKSNELQFPQDANDFQSRGMSSQMDVRRREKQSVSRKRYSREELLKLIQGVEEYMSRYCRWELIKKKYFADSHRSASQLKHAWKHIMKNMKKMEDPKVDPELRELYTRAQKADDAKRATEKVPRR